MKTMRKLLSLLFVMMLMVTFCLSSVALATESTFVESKNYISVSGIAGSYANISVMLKKTGAALSEDSILYIGQTTADENGRYTVDFVVMGDHFTVSDGSVTNYEVIVNADGVATTDTIDAKATVSEVVSFDVDLSTKGKAKAVFECDARYKNLDYVALIAFYGANSKLLKVTSAKGYIGDNGIFNYGADNIPAETLTVKGFFWESGSTMIPIVGAEVASFVDKSYSRTAEYVTMAPGGNESERNFAWYDIPDAVGLRVQYAEKVNGTAADFATAKTFNATYGSTKDIWEWNGSRQGLTGVNYFGYGHNYTWAKATITGLEKGKTYVYRFGDDEGWLSGIYEFTTDATPENGFKALLVSDEHVRPGISSVLSTLDQTYAKAFETVPNASLVIATGDQLDYPKEEIAFKEYYSREHSTKIPVATVPGTTHDINYENTRNEFEVSLYGFHTNMPNAHETSGKLNNIGSNYWYTYGDVLFIGINFNGWSSDDPEVQNAFIQEAVAQADAEAAARGSEIKFRVLYSHYPMGYSSSEDRVGKYYGDGSDLIADNGIDIVFHGHEHAYWRTHQVYGGAKAAEQPTSTDNLHWTITNPSNSAAHISLNTAGLLGGVVTDDGNYSKLQPFIAYTDTQGQYGLMGDYRGKSYTSHFSVLDIDTEGDEYTLTVNTYRNVFEGAAADAANTEKEKVTLTSSTLIDSYKIVKTN